MKIAAYQFAVTSDIRDNCRRMEEAVREAAGRQNELVVFPERALTGYPPRDIKDAESVDSTNVEQSVERLAAVAKETGTAILFGTVAKESEQYYNRAVFLSPDG